MNCIMADEHMGALGEILTDMYVMLRLRAYMNGSDVVHRIPET